MVKAAKLKNKLFKGLTEHDILTWEEEKMRYVITKKEGVASGFLTGQGAIYDKGETLLERYRTQTKSEDSSAEPTQSPKTTTEKRLLGKP